MVPLRSTQVDPGGTGPVAARRPVHWWRVLTLGSLVLVLALSPSSYNRSNRKAMARQLVVGTLPLLPWFTLLAALMSAVLARIVVVTAESYGLSQYALEMVFRVLVLELLPLTAALFVALRCAVPSGAELVAMHTRGAFGALPGIDRMRQEVLPRVVASIFSVLLLAVVSFLVTVVLAYVAIHGFTGGGVHKFTRLVGQVFGPSVMLILVLKTLLFSLAVALIPVAAYLRGAAGPRTDAHTRIELDSLVRLFAATLLITVLSLIGNYFW